MAAELLVDTSVWIQLLRDDEGGAADRVRRSLRLGEAGMAGPIATELMRGARTNKEIEALERLFRLVHCFEIDETLYREAGSLGFSLARRGITIGTVDLVLAQVALAYSVPILTLDRHFAMIAEHSELRILPSG